MNLAKWRKFCSHVSGYYHKMYLVIIKLFRYNNQIHGTAWYHAPTVFLDLHMVISLTKTVQSKDKHIHHSWQKSSFITVFQNCCPIWLPHWPTCNNTDDMSPPFFSSIRQKIHDYRSVPDASVATHEKKPQLEAGSYLWPEVGVSAVTAYYYQAESQMRHKSKDRLNGDINRI